MVSYPSTHPKEQLHKKQDFRLFQHVCIFQLTLLAAICFCNRVGETQLD